MATDSALSNFGNTHKLLSDCSNSALNVILKNDSKYFSLLNEKEKLSYHLLERDTELFKKKNELNTDISVHNENNNQFQLLMHNALQFPNNQIENIILFNKNDLLFFFERQKIEHNIKLQLDNGITIEEFKSIKENHALPFDVNSSLAFSNKRNQAQAENLNLLYKDDQESALLYLAFHL